MRQLQLIAHGEPSDVIELNTVFEPVLGQEEVLVSMEAAPLNPSDFTLVRGIYGVRPVTNATASHLLRTDTTSASDRARRRSGARA
jgi:NADPH:quinone reductase-like Zn-dependent oxidoreductase